MMTETIKTEIQPAISLISPASMPSLIKSEPEMSPPLTDSLLSEEAVVSSLFKALIALHPSAKNSIIQSILSSGALDSNPGVSETLPHSAAPPSVTALSPGQPFVTMSTSTHPTSILPSMSIPSTSIMLPHLPTTNIISATTPPQAPTCQTFTLPQIPTCQTFTLPQVPTCQTFTLPQVPTCQTFTLPQVPTCQTFTTSPITFTPAPPYSSIPPASHPQISTSLNLASLPQISTSLNLASSLPQLVPVTSDFNSLVAATASTSVMDSGNPTHLTSHPLVTNHPRFGQMSFVTALMRNSGVPLTTNSSELTTTVIDRSSTDSEEQLNIQARKLEDQLAQVRSKLLLSSVGGGFDSEYLDKLVKLEQLIHVLQEAVAQKRQVDAAQPSVILGGARRGSEHVNVLIQPGYGGLGAKRKGSPKSAQKSSGKKLKHSGGSHGIQLWQFILELLGDTEHSPVLAWTGTGLEFRIINSVELARLWGIRKRNPIMNFDKLSRALRYYYEKNIIKHNPMHRLVYSFCRNPDDMVYNALLNRALTTCPIDPEIAKQQAGESPYKWQDNLSKVPSSFKVTGVTLQAVRNQMNGMVEDEKFPLSVNNS